MSKRREHWTQTNPKNQLITTQVAMENCLTAFETGQISKEKMAARMKGGFEQLRLLLQMVGDGTWDE